MPIKLGKSQTTVDRTTKKRVTVNPYIKGFARAELIEKYNNTNTRAKDKQKIKNELVSRGGVVFS
jgi:SOS response regulatory protein OraA/RecX